MVWLGTTLPLVRPPHLTLVLAGLAFGTAVRHSTEVPFERFLELTACNIASNGSEARTHHRSLKHFVSQIFDGATAGIGL